MAEKNSSKVIPAAGLQNVEQWQPPEMAQTRRRGGDAQGSGALLTAAQLEQIQREAYEEGFEQGKREGFAYGHKEALEQGRGKLREQVQRLDTLFAALNTPFKELDEQVEQELVTLAIAVVRQLVRREVKTDPAQIVGVVRDALSILPVASRNIRVVLHPEDAELLRQIYHVSQNELGWKIVEDPVLGRGGCKVLTDTSQVDATLESRLAALIAPLLGGERADEE